jgi:hypothetical protein
MYINNKLIIAKNNDSELSILPKMANRHGIITGATGTGKTTTVKVLAESFSAAGIPVFLADIKGDLSATCEIGIENETITKRINDLKLDQFKFDKFPVRFWDIYGTNGHAVRAKIESFTASLLSRILELTESQEGNLNIVLKIAKDENMPIIDFKDLKALLTYVSENKNKYISTYGNITTQSISTIQRKLLEFENTGGEIFFKEPELELADLIRYDMYKGYGYINILDATQLVKDYNLYSTFMLWILNELYNKLPEVGDLEKPKLVVFIDEAHMLFDEMKPAMLKKITQIVKLIRSKGIGLYFISQSPSDIPEDILSQLGNRIQHNLKAYTPQEMKSVKVAAQSFRENTNFNTEKAILELSTGEALISFINENGQPNIVEKAFILPPQSKIGVVSSDVRNNIINTSELKSKYDINIESNSAYEIINAKQKEEKNKEEKKQDDNNKKNNTKVNTKKSTTKKKKSTLEKTVDRTINSAANSIGRKIVNELWKGLFK